MQLAWLALAVAGTVGYHVVLKLSPTATNPFVSLALTYLTGAVAFAVLASVWPGPMSLRESVARLNWTVLALAVVIVMLDLGFLMLYRSGFEISLAQVITQAFSALLLIGIGVAFFREPVSASQLAGLALCVAGLWLVNRR
jgi:multidrug transporter EmrE-like cation transporter